MASTERNKQLTPKQEKFAQCVVSGMTQADAYRTAYSAEKMKSDSIVVNASKLMADTNVALRVTFLREQLAEKALWTREDSVNKLKEALDIADRPNDIVSVIKELNAMHGFNAPIKQEIEHKGAVQIFVPDTNDDL